MNGKQATDYHLKAVKRYQAGESATTICRSLGKTRRWLYKWLKRIDELKQGSTPIRAHNRTAVLFKVLGFLLTISILSYIENKMCFIVSYNRQLKNNILLTFFSK